MLLMVKANTSVKDLIIEYIEITNELGKNITLNWEQSEVTRTDTGFEGSYLGVCFGEKLADGKLSELYGMTVDAIGLYSEQKGKLDIEVTEMYFYEDDKDLTFENPYRAEDNEAFVELRSKFEKFVKEQIEPSDEEFFTAFTENEDESGLYDIAYNLKPIIQDNEFNPFSADERASEDYDQALDDWFDGFIESDILPILRRVAYERKEGNYE